MRDWILAVLFVGFLLGLSWVVSGCACPDGACYQSSPIGRAERHHEMTRRRQEHREALQTLREIRRGGRGCRRRCR